MTKRFTMIKNVIEQVTYSLTVEADSHEQAIERAMMGHGGDFEYVTQDDVEYGTGHMPKIIPNGMFNTFESMADLETYFDSFIPEEKALLWKGAMFMWNHLAHTMAQAETMIGEVQEQK